VDKVQRKKLSVGETAADISRPFELDLIQQVTAVSRLWYKKKGRCWLQQHLCVSPKQQ
jgi:hypothetical protein